MFKSELVTLADMPQYDGVNPQITWNVVPHIDVDAKRVVLDTGRLGSLMRTIGVGALTVNQFSSEQDDAPSVNLGRINPDGTASALPSISLSRLRRGKGDLHGHECGVPFAYKKSGAAIAIDRTAIGRQVSSRVQRGQDIQHVWTDQMDRSLKQSLQRLYLDKLKYDMHGNMKKLETAVVTGLIARTAMNILDPPEDINLASGLSAPTVYAFLYCLSLVADASLLRRFGPGNVKWYQRRWSAYFTDMEHDRIAVASLRTLLGGRLIGVKG